MRPRVSSSDETNGLFVKSELTGQCNASLCAGSDVPNLVISNFGLVVPFSEGHQAQTYRMMGVFFRCHVFNICVVIVGFASVLMVHKSTAWNWSYKSNSDKSMDKKVSFGIFMRQHNGNVSTPVNSRFYRLSWMALPIKAPDESVFRYFVESRKRLNLNRAPFTHGCHSTASKKLFDAYQGTS
jgi:hypothetical protein